MSFMILLEIADPAVAESAGRVRPVTGPKEKKPKRKRPPRTDGDELGYPSHDSGLGFASQRRVRPVTGPKEKTTKPLQPRVPADWHHGDEEGHVTLPPRLTPYGEEPEPEKELPYNWRHGDEEGDVTLPTKLPPFRTHKPKPS